MKQNLSKVEINKYLKTIKKDQQLKMHSIDNHDLFFIVNGKFIVLVVHGQHVTPVAIIGPGEYIGELSFFDNRSRSAYLIAMEDSEVLEFPESELKDQIPEWLNDIGKKMTKTIRNLDEVINRKGIRKKQAKTIEALSIEQERIYLNIIQSE